MKTAIGGFTSRDRAEEALKELVRTGVPENSILFLTRSQSEAIALGKEMGSFARGFTGGAVGLGSGMVSASLALIPGLGQVFAVGVGAAALLGILGTNIAAAARKGISPQEATASSSPDEEFDEDAHLILDSLKTGRSLIVVRTESSEIAKLACGILERAALSTHPHAVPKMQADVRYPTPEVAAIEVKGRIIVGEASLLLRETVQKLVGDGSRKVLLLLQDVDYIDSSGIGELVRAHTVIRRANGQLKIVNPSAKVEEMLHMTMLHKVLDVHKDEDSALRSFVGGPAASAATAS